MKGTATHDRGKEVQIPWNNFFICIHESQAIQKMTQSVVCSIPPPWTNRRKKEWEREEAERSLGLTRYIKCSIRTKEGRKKKWQANQTKKGNEQKTETNVISNILIISIITLIGIV